MLTLRMRFSLKAQKLPLLSGSGGIADNVKTLAAGRRSSSVGATLTDENMERKSHDISGYQCKLSYEKLGYNKSVRKGSIK